MIPGSPMLWLCGILAAAVPITYGYGKVREQIVVTYAVKAARAEEQATARTQIAEVERRQRQASDRTVDDATEGAQGVGLTPIDQAELDLLCDKDRWCRERAKAKGKKK